MVLVDTSAWIELHRKDGDAGVKLAMLGLLDAFEATLCGPVEMEFLGGAQSEQRLKLQAWCNLLPYLRNDQTLWRKTAANFSQLRGQGVTVPWNDLLVATLAIENDCRVYAVDQHFETISRHLKLRLYTPGYGGSYLTE
ncbi:MAG TPA: PIN domain-containing protein [Luteolibacter sp.]|nr:PIN domain-containing protein [Luteolibacter sp.]